MAIRRSIRANRIAPQPHAQAGACGHHTTAEELDALARFYGSPEGRAITKKFGVYTAEVQPFVHAEIVRAVKELQSRERFR